MRFGLVLHGELSGASGGFLYDRMLVERLQARGHTVDRIELAWRSYGACLLRNLGGRSFDSVVSYPGDLLIQDELAHPSLVRANQVRRRRGAGPAVAIVHLLRSSEKRSASDRALSRQVEAAYLRGVDGMVFNSDATRAAAESLMGERADGVVVTPGGDRLGPGILNGWIEERGLRSGPLRVLFVANLLRAKGLLTVLEALSRLPPDQWELTVAGSAEPDAGFAEEARRAAGRLGPEARIRFTGHLDGEALAAEYRSHHVLAVPSAYEAFGIVYLEAMGFGLGPVGTTAGGAREVIEPGISGYLVRPGDVEGVADVLRRLQADRDLLCRVGTEARRRFERLPGWEQSMDAACDYLCAVAVRARDARGSHRHG